MNRPLTALILAAALVLAPAVAAQAVDPAPEFTTQGIGREGPDTDIYNNPKVIGQRYMAGLYLGSGAEALCVKNFLAMWKPRKHLSVKRQVTFAGEVCVSRIAILGDK